MHQSAQNPLPVHFLRFGQPVIRQNTHERFGGHRGEAVQQRQTEQKTENQEAGEHRNDDEKHAAEHGQHTVAAEDFGDAVAALHARAGVEQQQTQLLDWRGEARGAAQVEPAGPAETAQQQADEQRTARRAEGEAAAAGQRNVDRAEHDAEQNGKRRFHTAQMNDEQA